MNYVRFKWDASDSNCKTLSLRPLVCRQSFAAPICCLLWPLKLVRKSINKSSGPATLFPCICVKLTTASNEQTDRQVEQMMAMMIRKRWQFSPYSRAAHSLSSSTAGCYDAINRLHIRLVVGSNVDCLSAFMWSRLDWVRKMTPFALASLMGNFR